MLTDPIADMLTRIRNAGRAGHPKVAFPGSKLKESILGILQDEGFIAGYANKRNGNLWDIEVELKYYNRKSVIKELERVSSPGRRLYSKSQELKPVRNNLGVAIVSTPKGVMTSRKAKSLNVGGEIICRVW